MQERKVVLTWETIYDVTDIADYIEQEFGRERADRFERDIRQEIRDISLLGGIFGNTQVFPEFEKGLKGGKARPKRALFMSLEHSCSIWKHSG